MKDVWRYLLFLNLVLFVWRLMVLVSLVIMSLMIRIVCKKLVNDNFKISFYLDYLEVL